jgi:hypothetical protein
VAIELAEMIGRLREDLAEAMHAGDGAELLFELGPVELELTVAMAKEAGPSAKVKFWVVELGADTKFTANSTQKIKLTLEPRSAAQPDRKPLISGAEQENER